MTHTHTDDIANDARLDNWNDGALDGIRGNAKASTDADYLDGYADGQRRRRIRVVMPARPEGYYHTTPTGEA